MKVCTTCGVEIYTKDRENQCSDCENRDAVAAKKAASKSKAAAARKARDEVLRSLGLKKVRGAMGGTYWE